MHVFSKSNNCPYILPQLQAQVNAVHALCKPSAVYWCNGSPEEYDLLCEQLVAAGTMVRLNPSLRPNCFVARTDPDDTRRRTDCEVVACNNREHVGPKEAWMSPVELKRKVHALFEGCMAGRTMYVVPFAMCPTSSPVCRIAVEITDSPYVVVNMRILTRMGDVALDHLHATNPSSFIFSVHSVGSPIDAAHPDVSWPCRPDNVLIAHFLEEPSVWSYGSGFGANAFLSKRAIGLRLASWMGRSDPRFLTSHCSVLSLTNPRRKKVYIANGFPMGTSKRTIAQLVSSLPGWTLQCYSDDFCWMTIGEDGRLYAVNPEVGFFGVASGTSYSPHRTIMDSVHANTIFTNVAVTPDGDVWWEGMTEEIPESLTDWTGAPWSPECGRPAAHINSRYTCPIEQCPVIDDRMNDPRGVPISAITFAHRRQDTVPVVHEAFSWHHGIFLGASISVEEFEARGRLIPEHRDAMAMAPFVGGSINDYISQWLDLRRYLGYSSPRIFAVNWFIRDTSLRTTGGRELGQNSEVVPLGPCWPGFAENTRILRWIAERIEGSADAIRTAIGYVPSAVSLDLTALSISRESLNRWIRVDPEAWKPEVESISAYFKSFGPGFPSLLFTQLEQLKSRLEHSNDTAEPMTHNTATLRAVAQAAVLCQPDHIHWCTGSADEYDQLCSKLVEDGVLRRLNPRRWPGCFVARSDPRDVLSGRDVVVVEDDESPEAGPAAQHVESLMRGSMAGRVMYVVPFCAGPIGSPHAIYGLQITDSPYVVVHMHLLSRIGTKVLTAFGDTSSSFVTCLHSMGRAAPAPPSLAWPCDPDRAYLGIFVKDNRIVSYGTNYGDGAFLFREPLCLRYFSIIARDRRACLAERMSILGVESPTGQKHYMCAAHPDESLKANLSTIVPTLPGWTVRCVGDNVAWLHIGADGQLHAINPVAGFYGVAPGMSAAAHPATMRMIRRNTIFTNVAETPDGDVWWEGMTKEPPPALIDWTGCVWKPSGRRDDNCSAVAAHPRAHFAVGASESPVMDPQANNPNGVPICAFIFSSYRLDLYPLVVEAFSWQHGVLSAAMVGYDDPADASRVVRVPLASSPCIGYGLSDYVSHWVDFRRLLGYSSPKIYHVNWGRRVAESGGCTSPAPATWPGGGENIRILGWICDRLGRNPVGRSVRTPIGHIPTPSSMDFSGLDLAEDAVCALLHPGEASSWHHEIKSFEADWLTMMLGLPMPEALINERDDLLARLRLASEGASQTTNRALLEWVARVRAQCRPKEVYWCTGSDAEYQALCNELVASRTFIRLNENLRENCYLARSDVRDVARVEARTFIACRRREDAGPTNNWADPDELQAKLDALLDGAMVGRTMYVVPFCMGPLGSPFSVIGIQLTDSPYVVVSMKIMTRMGAAVLAQLHDDDEAFVPCLHSVGRPLPPGTPDVPWPCDPERVVVAHFENRVVSYGSGYGGNALLGKKCLALRIATRMARDQGWLAEHMLILGIVSPAGKKYYMCAAFPSACGKTNLAMLVPTLPGWTVRCVGDDIAWLRVGVDGQLHAINPEAGFFGVAPGTSELSNPSAMRTIRKNTIFTNVAETPDGDVWWEGLTKEPPPALIDWTGAPWSPGCGRPAAHPNSRYTVPAGQCPVMDPEWENPNGVPICALVFGGRRARLVPLVLEAFIWEQGVLFASSISSEQTAAAEGQVGAIRRDPFAMLPFCGYNMADYFGHWLAFRQRLGYLSPKIFMVNWFRRDAAGRFIWPGFGENSRVLKWICERVDGTGAARSTPMGYLPTIDAIDLDGLDPSVEAAVAPLLQIDERAWLDELAAIRAHFAMFGDRLPPALLEVLVGFEDRLRSSHAAPAAAAAHPGLSAVLEDLQRLLGVDRIVWHNGTEDELAEALATAARDAAAPPPSAAAALPAAIPVAAPYAELLPAVVPGRPTYAVPFSMSPLGGTGPASCAPCVLVSDSPSLVVAMHGVYRVGSAILSTASSKNRPVVFLWVGLDAMLQTTQEPPSGHSHQTTQTKPTPPEGPYERHGVNIYVLRASCAEDAFADLREAVNVGAMAKPPASLLRSRMAVLSVGRPTPAPAHRRHSGGLAVITDGATPAAALAMLVPNIPGWSVGCLGLDYAWFHVGGEDCSLFASMPEAGFMLREQAPGAQRNRAVEALIQRDAIVLGAPHPWAHAIVRAEACPLADPSLNAPDGVPIAAILVLQSRSDAWPLVCEATSWERGLLIALAATRRAAAVRAPLQAQMPTWADLRAQLGYNTPRVFAINLGRCAGSDNRRIWSDDAADNARLLKWVLMRLAGDAPAVKLSPTLGLVPLAAALDLRGMPFDVTARVTEALAVDDLAVRTELLALRDEGLPAGLDRELAGL